MKTSGLSLAEAHASGRKYRRASQPASDGFYRIHEEGNMSKKDALATDYELESEAKLLTREELYFFICRGSGQLRQELANTICDTIFGSEEGVR